MTQYNDQPTEADDMFSLLETDAPTMPQRAVAPSARCTRTGCHALIAGVRAAAAADGWCRLCDRTARPTTMPDPAPVHRDRTFPIEPTPVAIVAEGTAPVDTYEFDFSQTPTTPVPSVGTAAPNPDESGPDLSALPADLAESLGTAFAEGQIMAAQADTVRGGVSRANVNAVAGFQAGAGITREQANQAASLTTEASQRAFGQTDGASAPVAPIVAAPMFVPSTPLALDLPTPLRQRIVAARSRRGIKSANLTPDQQARVDAADRRERERMAIDGAISVALAGPIDGQYAHGLLAAWRPSGERNHAALKNAIDAANLGWIDAPEPRSLRAIASDAVRALESEGYRVAVRRRGSSWAIYQQTDVASVGGSVGETFVIASFADDALILEGPDHLCAAIRTVWETARTNGSIGTNEITAWLVGACKALRATDTVYGRWIAPGLPSERWLALAAVLADLKYPVRRRPAAVASRLDVADEIRDGITAEIASLMTEIEDQRETVKCTGTADKPRDLGVRAAVTRLDEIAALRAKLATFECLIGPCTEERARLTAMELQLADLVDPVYQRGALLELS